MLKYADYDFFIYVLGILVFISYQSSTPWRKYNWLLFLSMLTVGARGLERLYRSFQKYLHRTPHDSRGWQWNLTDLTYISQGTTSTRTTSCGTLWWESTTELYAKTAVLLQSTVRRCPMTPLVQTGLDGLSGSRPMYGNGFGSGSNKDQTSNFEQICSQFFAEMPHKATFFADLTRFRMTLSW